MPINYTIKENGTFVHAIVSGILTTEEICNYEQETSENIQIKPYFRELFDLSQMAESKVDEKGFHRIVEMIRMNPKRSSLNKLAIVAGKGDSFEHARYFERLVSPHKQNVIVFNHISTAKQWLGVE